MKHCYCSCQLYKPLFVERCRVTSPKDKIKFLSSNKISEIQHKKYLALYNSLQSDWLTRADRNEVRSKILKMNFSISPSQLCSHTLSALNAGAKRSEATCRVPDVSAQDVSATRWRKTFRQLFVAETSLVPKRLHSR